MKLHQQTGNIHGILCIIVITLPFICAIRIVAEEMPTSTTTPLHERTTTYRVSVPRPQRPSNRVPPHLQDIHVRTAGYVDDDADDVIHIIEPPSYFQQLKHQAHRQQAFSFQAPKPQLTIDTPKKPSSSDLLTQETQNSVKKTLQPKQKFANIWPMQFVGGLQKHHQQPNALPFELLASVRHKDRIFQRNRPLTAAPFARERVKMKKIQTVLTEQGYEQQEHDRGQQLTYGLQQQQQRRASGIFNARRRERRVHRSVESLANEHLNQDLSSNILSQQSQNLDQKSSKDTRIIQSPYGHLRQKRAVSEKNSRARKTRGSKTIKSNIEAKNTLEANPNPAKRKAELQQKYSLLKGNELIEHITELLNNATQYASDGLRLIRLSGKHKIAAPAATTLKEFPDEIQPTIGVQLKETHINKILEHSLNTTDAIMVALLNYTKLSQEQCTEKSGSNNAPRQRMQLLQSRIDCIRQQIGSEQNTKTTPSTLTTRHHQAYGERISGKSTATKPSNTNVAATMQRRKQQVHNSSATLLTANLQEQLDNELSGTTSASNVSATLLYDDIMTNIRNMQQTDGSREQQTDLATRRSVQDATQTSDFGEFNHLNEYLNELQKIVSDFITTPSNVGESGGDITATTELTLNTREYMNSLDGTSTEPLKTWYLINKDGQIYQTNLADELHPTVAVFRHFPDIPRAEIYFQNLTLLTDKTKAYEIL